VDVEEIVPDAELARLHKIGVRGVRINVSPIHPPEAGLAEKLLVRSERLEAHCAELDWHLSQTPGFADAAPMARALLETAPDRILWGSDYPHLSFTDQVGAVELFSLLGSWAANDATRQAVLVRNPARLFGF